MEAVMNLLAIFAHPDDEVFSCGGTLSRYAAEGHSVYLICTTRGEEGEIIHPEIDAERYPKGEARGKLREEELKEACTALGIQAPIFLNHQDSGFPIEVGLNNPKAFMNQDVLAIEQELLESISKIKPNVMITFDPHGMYGHIDHVVIHRAALAAFWSAGGVMQNAPQRLYYPMRSSAQVEHMKATMNSTTINTLDPKIYGVSPDSFAALLDVSAYAESKRKAILAHRSQVGVEANLEGMSKVWGDMFKQEGFVLGGLRGSFPKMPVTDLLEGMGPTSPPSH
jgi:N-acetyl-1-D-myo-inositol-2-amino-2-deoxy-alpha-D-glucopyranoside deacetylase